MCGSGAGDSDTSATMAYLHVRSCRNMNAPSPLFSVKAMSSASESFECEVRTSQLRAASPSILMMASGWAHICLFYTRVCLIWTLFRFMRASLTASLTWPGRALTASLIATLLSLLSMLACAMRHAPVFAFYIMTCYGLLESVNHGNPKGCSC